MFFRGNEPQKSLKKIPIERKTEPEKTREYPRMTQKQAKIRQADPVTGLPGASFILGMRVHHTSYRNACALVCEWAGAHESRYICVAPVYNVMYAWDSPEFRKATNGADITTPDGMPLVWALKFTGFRDATRVYGPDLTPQVLSMAEERGFPVGFYGAAPDVLERLVSVVRGQFPALRIAYAFSPPFRPPTPEEDLDTVNSINGSGVRILFVGLTTPKQDFWMAAHRGRIQAVMLGVGAAFDFLSGSKAQAPRWMMRIGMEWFFRLLTEPRRLWKRYLKHNPRFVVLFACQLLGVRLAGFEPGEHDVSR
jgi:N-acetylglucosaminyldiphosphoundecaprenol N-acetyl-beta-D-mannosaminyltransferase